MPKTIFGEDTEEYQAFMEANKVIAPGAVEFMHIVQQCWQSYADYHTWVMPDGFVVIIPVIQSKVVKIEVDELDHLSFNHTVNIVEGEEKGISLAANIN